MAFILGIILLMIINYYHNVPDVGFMMTVMIMDMMLVIGNMMAKKHCDDDSDRDCTFPSLHFQHHLEISTGGMLQEMESLEFVGLSKSVPLKNPSLYCHSYPTFGVTFLPSNLPSTPWAIDPNDISVSLLGATQYLKISSCRNSSEVMVIKGQKDGFWGVTFLDKSQIFGDPVKVFKYFNLVHWTNIDNVLSRLNHSQLFRSTWL